MRTKLSTIVLLIAVLIVSSSANAQVFNYKFGGAKDVEISRLLKVFGPLNVRCGNPATDFEATLALDTTLTPPVVTLSEVGKGPFSSGPVTEIDWIKDMRPDEFGHPVSIVALWNVKFLWDADNKGNGQMTFEIPGPSSSPRKLYSC